MKNAIFALACALLVPMLLISVSSSATYDPWVDLDADGNVDIFDVVKLAGAYQTIGDPTKNVTVTNWPTSSAVTEWYLYQLADGAYVTGTVHNADGYSTLHVLVYIFNLTVGEIATLQIYAPLFSADRQSYYTIVAYQQAFNSTARSAAVTLPVPSERFWFRFYAAAGTTCAVSLSCYLTWA